MPNPGARAAGGPPSAHAQPRSPLLPAACPLRMPSQGSLGSPQLLRPLNPWDPAVRPLPGSGVDREAAHCGRTPEHPLQYLLTQE